MSQTTTSRKRLRAVFAGVSAVILVAGLSSAVRSADRPAPSPAGPMVPAAYRRASSAGQRRLGSAAARAQQQRVQAIADASGWNWRAAGVAFVIGFHPEACCHWGVYDWRSSTIYVGPTAFATADRLRYVVLHETAHAWQYLAGPTQALTGDYAHWGYAGANALEAGADCMATLWGAAPGQSHYWRCPAAALAVAARELGRD